MNNNKKNNNKKPLKQNKNNKNKLQNNEPQNIQQTLIDSLFFKVFRNLVIRNTILGFIKCGFNISNYEYNSIISTEFMIKNGLFQLLFEKVKRSEYLIFNNDIDGPNYCNNNNGSSNSLNSYIEDTNGRIIMKKEYSIFNCFKTNGDENSNSDDGNEDYKNSKGYQFYKNLFGNYSKQFPSKDHLFTIGVEYDNLSILRVLKYVYHISPNPSTSKLPQPEKVQLVFKQLIKSINIGSFKVSELFSRYLPNPFSTFKDSSGNLVKLYGDLFKETVGNFQEQFENVQDIKFFNEKVQFLICKLNYPYPNIDLISRKIVLYNGLFKMLIYQKSLQLVIECCRTLIHLKLDSYFEKDFTQIHQESITNPDYDYKASMIYIKYKIYKEFNNFKLPTIQSFEEMISSCNFTNNEMQSKIYDLEFGSSSSCSGIVGEEDETNNKKLDTLIKCFQMLIVFTDNKNEMFSNWLFFKLKYFNLNYNEYYNTLIKIPELDKIRFGLYSITGEDGNGNGIDIDNQQLLSKQQLEHTFLYCKSNWTIQESFFKEAIKDIKQGIANSNLLDELIKIACRSSSFSIELLKLVKSELKIKSFSIEQLKSFKTAQLVDYVLNNFSSNSGLKDHFSDLLQINLFNYQIANHLKTNYEMEFKYEIISGFCIDSNIHTTINKSNNSLNFKFIKENWNNNFRSINFILSKFNDCNEFEQFITTHSSSIKLATINKPINFYGLNKRLSIQQTNYMYNLKSQLFLNNTFMPPPDPISFLTRYLRNEFIDLFNIDNNNNNNCTILPNSKSIYMVLNEISKRGDIKTLDFLLSDKFNDKEFKKYIIKYVLFKSSKYGQLSILQYISNKNSLKKELNYLKLLNSNTTVNNNNEKEKKRKSNRKSDINNTTTTTKTVNNTKSDENYTTLYNIPFKSLQNRNNKQFIDPNFTVDDWHFIFIKYLLPNGFIELIKFISSEYEYKINLNWLNDLIGKEKHLISINNYLILPQILPPPKK